ncbi:ComEA family DNA-binding protein [Microbispora siamensis]|uniref:ComEA family DNA-binding protein n=1 Tax=Microbispora siamensis TaxID=564413 RepID=UPI001EF301E9|nr:ComEA family DNA-binding protein [Microbispora siamensis]
MRSKEFRGAARGVAGESRLRGLLRPLDPVPPSARLRSTPSPPGPPPSFGAPHLVRTETYVPEHPAEVEDGPYREETFGMPEEVADRREGRADGPGTTVRCLRTRGRQALGRTLPRLDPGMPGLRALVAAGLLAAVVTGVLAWRSRPVAEPIAPPLPAAAVRDLSPAADPAADHAAGPGAAPGETSRPAPARGTGVGAGAGPGATAYVAGTGGTVAATPGPSTRVVVYVTGKVRKPGVYVLVSGSRVADAVEAAGGLRKGANPGGINLARRLVDGEQIVAGSPATAGAGPASGRDPGMVPGVPGGGVVNLNTATAEQLDALPGIGGVIAQRIVDYRDAHGGFQSVDQLKDVPGIGDRKFAEMRDKVSV